MTYNPKAAYEAHVKAQAEAAATGGATASQEEITKLPESKEGAENVAEQAANPSEVTTEEPKVPTKAEEAPETPVEPYNTSESPEKLAAGVVSEIKKIEEGVTQVINEDRAVGELENIAQEMLNLIAEKGAMTSAESMMFTVAVQNACKGLDDGADIPSFESFLDAPEVAAHMTEVSLEGVLDKIATTLNNFSTRLEKSVKDLFGLANSLTPLLNRVKTRAEAVRSKVNNSNREAGLKEVSGKFVAKLSIDGHAPEAKTVVQRSALMAQLSTEVFGRQTIDAASAFGREAISVVGDAVNLKEAEDRPSLWWFVFVRPELLGAIFKNRVGNAFRLEGGKMPDFYKLFPSAAKINHSAGDEAHAKFLDVKRSETLFGEKALAVSQYKNEVTVGLAGKVGPSLRLIELNPTTNVETIQTLTSQQQAQVLDNVIKTLDSSIEYYKSYAARSKAAMDTYRQGFQKLRGLQKDARLIKDLTLINSMPHVIDGMARLFMRGVFQQQGKIAQYFSTSCDALIQLADKSASATQADDKDDGTAAANKAEAESKE